LVGVVGRRRRRRRRRRRSSTAAAAAAAADSSDGHTYPRVWPTELHVPAYPTFLRESMVSAHPSTAMSCVAMRK